MIAVYINLHAINLRTTLQFFASSQKGHKLCHDKYNIWNYFDQSIQYINITNDKQDDNLQSYSHK